MSPKTDNSEDTSGNNTDSEIHRSQKYGEIIKEYAPAVGSLGAGTWMISPQETHSSQLLCELHHTKSLARIQFVSLEHITEGATEMTVYSELPDHSEVKQSPDDVNDMLVYSEKFPMLEWAVWMAEFFARNIDSFNHQM